MDTSNTLLETQKEIERIFNKNQLMFRVKSEFKKEPEIKEIMDKFNIPNDFGYDFLAQMALHKRANIQTIVGLLRHHYDNGQMVVNMIVQCIHADLVDWFDDLRVLVTKFELSKDGSTKTVMVKPKAHRIQKQKIYQIGIVAKSNENAGVKLKRGWDTAVSTTGLIFNAVGNLFRHFSLNKLSGPVGIYSQTSQVSQMGFTYVLAFLAMISINLGIVNLIPIPGLDGGKLLLNLIELVRGKPISEEHEAIVELIGFGLLLVLIIAVTGNDIYRYFIK